MLLSLGLQACGTESSLNPVPEPRWTATASAASTPPPSPVVLSPPAGVVLSNPLPTFMGNATPGVRVRLRIDGRDPVDVTADPLGLWQYTPPPAQSLTGGPHRLTVVAVDALGNTSPQVEGEFAVELLAPDTFIRSGPPATTRERSADFDFSSTALLVGYECALDSGAFAGCSNPLQLDSLAEGTHRLRVRSYDLLGLLVDPTPAVHVWTVDLTPPTVTLDIRPPVWSAVTVADFAFSSSEPATFTCGLGGAGVACTSSFTTPVLEDGPHTFSVMARDAAGNASSAPVVWTWNVDTVAPAAPGITLPRTGSTLAGSPDLATGFAEPGATVRIVLGEDMTGFTVADATGAWRFAMPGTLTDGDHVLGAVAVDAAGNAGSATTVAFRVDGRSSDTVIQSGPPVHSASTQATLTLAAGRTDATFECSVDGAAFAACSNPAFLAGLSEGSHTFGARAVTPAGVRDASPATYVWTVDTLAPTVRVAEGPPAATTAREASFTFEASEALVTFECALDDGALAPCEAVTGFRGLAPGPHTLVMRARDAAGNVSPSVARAWSILDNGGTAVPGAGELIGGGKGCSSAPGGGLSAGLLALAFALETRQRASRRGSRRR